VSTDHPHTLERLEKVAAGWCGANSRVERLCGETNEKKAESKSPALQHRRRDTRNRL